MMNSLRVVTRCLFAALLAVMASCATSTQTVQGTDSEAGGDPPGRSVAAQQARDLALAARHAQDPDALGTALTRWREVAPGDEQAWSVTIQHALRTGQPELLRDAMRTWLSLRAGSHSRWEDLAISVREHWGEPALAQAAEAVMQELPLADSVLDNLFRSELAEALGLFDQAVRASERAVDRLQETDVPPARQVRTLRWHARLMGESGNRLAEISALRRALSIDPGATEVRLQMAQRLAASGFMDEAFNLLRESDNSDSRTALMLGLMAAQEERADVVAQALQRLEQGDGEQRLLHRAQLLAEVGRGQEALTLLDELVSGAMGDRARLERARLLAVLGRPGEARAALEPLLTAEVDDLAARAWLMQAQLDGAPNTEQSFRVLTRGLAAVPSNPDLLYARSLAAEQQGYLNTAERDLREVIEIEPDNAHAHNALGYMLSVHTDRLDEAEALIDKALSLAPREPAIIDSMGWLRYRQGRDVDALRLLRQAHEMGFNPEIAAHLIEVLAHTGQTQAARELLQESIELAPEHEKLQALQEQLP